MPDAQEHAGLSFVDRKKLNDLNRCFFCLSEPFSKYGLSTAVYRAKGSDFISDIMIIDQQ